MSVLVAVMLTPGSGVLPDFTAPLISPPFAVAAACTVGAATACDGGAPEVTGDTGCAGGVDCEEDGADCEAGFCPRSGNATSTAQHATVAQKKGNRMFLLGVLILLRGILSRGKGIRLTLPHDAHLR